MTGPLGALPKLSPSARRALVSTGILAAGNAAALIAQAWALATALSAIVTAGADAAAIGDRLAVLAVATIGRAGFGWATELVSARAAAGAKEELRRVLLDSSLRRGPEWIRERGAVELTSLATKGLDSLDAYFSKYLPALVTAAVVPPLVGAWILASDPIAALTIVVTVPLIPLFAWLVGRYTETRTSRAADAAQRLSGHVLELVRALPVLTAFGRARAQGEVVRTVSERHRRSTISTLRIAFLSALVLEFLASLSVALIAVGIGFRLVSGELDLATGLLVLVLAPECYMPLRAAGAAHHASEDGVEAVRRVDEVIPAGSDGSGDSLPGDGPLRVRDLRVRRRDGYAPDGLGFTARPGETVHLDGFDGIGPSGSGKSTTFAVLLGFTTPEAGGADYGGTDVEDIDRAEWRRLLAWVPQQPAFTGGTVADELALAVSDQPTGGDPAEALRQAGATHLASRRVDELSTGERQRIALARAFLRVRTGARILLLDEPTAHLDAATARHVNDEIRRVADRGTAVVLASHRPDTGRAEVEEPRAAGGEAPPVLPAARPHWRDLITARGLLGVGLGALSLVSGLALTATAAWLIARASQQPPVLALSVAAVGVRTFALSRAGFRYIERLATHDAAFRLSTRLRGRLWNGLVRLGPVRSTALRRDDGVARLVDDVDAVRDLVPRVLLPPAVAVIVALAAVAVQSMVLPRAGALLAGSLLLAGIGGSAVGLAAERRASLAVSEGRRRVSARVLALLDGAAELISFGAHTTRRAELAEEDGRLAARSRRAAFGSGAATAVLIVAVGAAVLGGVWLGADAVAAGLLAPELAPLLALVPLAAAEAVNPLPEAARQWRSLRAARSRLAPLLATGAADDGAADDGAADDGAPGTRHEDTESGAVRLRGVSARWPGADGSALRSANLVVPAGAHVAVVGPSGGGKSTLMALLLGFLRPEHGHLSVPARVSWCPQEPQLVATTLRENLRVAGPTADDRELAHALDRAGLPEWETRLDEFVGAGGAAVSGGEAQRIALARALLFRDAELMLLDEPTAHLDVPTSEALLSRMRHDLRNVTVFHVTHRWSETEHADIVVRVDDGEISVLREHATAGSHESAAQDRNVVSGGGE